MQMQNARSSGAGITPAFCICGVEESKRLSRTEPQ